MSEAVVIGGGLAGGAAATLLAAAGRRIHLIERDREPADKVCGEFLSIEAQRMLGRLGIDLDYLGASRIDRLALARGSRTIELRLPFVARGLSRRCLDAALLARATSVGARIDRGVAVRSIAGERIETSAGPLSSNLCLLASGKHEVRGAARLTNGCELGYVGFKMHWRLPGPAAAKLAGSVEVILFDGGYAGIQLVENDVANLCLLIDKPALSAAGGSWPALLERLFQEPRMESILGEAEPLWRKPQTISSVPYGYLHGGGGGALYRLGDQAAVIPSFCGEGMAIALHSAFAADAAIAASAGPAQHAAMLQRSLSRRLSLAMALQKLGRAGWSRALLLAALRTSPPLGRAFVHLTRVPGIA